ncbi:cisplatin damage response ATP-dependent DNA ligase [Hyphomicrobium sp. NDB2Meth4]|uniref:cisplatin damage response ATP-dependent DNA ligase n=1 Tax=Hyphomicrobium sp. NDB2Meth4 TaxID=1892846 RepID=UPI000931B530|nr:cisplatin damage response ATP-dependent DNA ligase [Hyphomicrobium sp. NDB2Meth4]
MQRFANLLDCLTTTPSRNGKLALLVEYFRSAPDPDRGYALAALTDGLFPRLPLRRAISELMTGRIDPVLYQMSRDYVGDTAETVSLLWPDKRATRPSPTLAEVVAALEMVPGNAVAPVLGDFLDRLDVRGRWALLKLIGGAPRVGVSARLARTALAQMSGHDLSEIEEIWHALKPPYAELFAWLEHRALRPDVSGKPIFRPLMLAHPIEEGDWANLSPSDIVAEWKWDGVRVQIAAGGGDVRIFSRSGDDISGSFPEVVAAFQPYDTVVDGELLVARDGIVAPFNDLQQRLNRKTVTAKMLREYPAFVRLYDILIDDGEDVRALSFDARRERLEAWHARHHPRASDVSAIVRFESFAELDALWNGAREAGIEGLMLKRRESPYLSGRPKGHWWKWKRAALTIDCVLMYAQRGSGKRSSYYSDYTFGVWRETAGDDGQIVRELVPVGKAYSGFTDEELLRLDRFIRTHTTEQFGPVRAVEQTMVLEIAFDAVFPSTRHKSGLAMRFPRVHRIRWDKPADEADTLETVQKLVVAPTDSAGDAAGVAAASR